MPDGHLMFWTRSPSSRRHGDLSTEATNPQHGLGGVTITFPVQPPDEFRRGRFRELAGHRQTPPYSAVVAWVALAVQIFKDTCGRT